MNNYLRAACLVAGLPLSIQTQAQHPETPHAHESHRIEEIVVSTSQSRSRSETALPVTVLSDEELRAQAGATLGETIRQTIGVHSSSFGAGVGQPVIRGLSGNRVMVLQNSLTTLDASGVSQDHASSVEALLAERIEIIRGPATLLYGNGAIGGVVNVIDNRVPTTLAEQTSGALEVRRRSVDEGKVAVGRLDGGLGNFAWHLNGVYRETDDYDIPGWAVDEAAVEALAHEGEEADHEPLKNSRGYVENSSTEAKQLTAGLSWVGDAGYVGISASRLNNEYGIPPGAHGHAEHEEHEEHEEEHEDEHEEEAHGESIRIDMEQSRYEARAGLHFDGTLERIELQLAANRYEHRELEGHEVGTRFENDGVEARFTANHGALLGWSGVLGVQLSDRDFSAIGEEAFIPPAEIRAGGLFMLESIDVGAMTYELGARLNRQRIATRGNCDHREDTWSASAAGIWNYKEDSNFSLSLSHSERAPTVEELYSNVALLDCATIADPEARTVHAATARYELGDPTLSEESANNLEIGWHKHLGELLAEVNLFYNRFDDFIYLADVGEFEEIIVSRYLQQDATLRGIEAELVIPIDVATQHIDLTLFGDYVDAELRSGANLPRIPPARLGFELSYALQNWALRLRNTKVAEQDDVGEAELSTEGYTRVDAYLDYHLAGIGEDLVIFAKAENLTDREIRDHTSFLKNFAPAPGRSFELGLRVRF